MASESVRSYGEKFKAAMVKLRPSQTSIHSTSHWYLKSTHTGNTETDKKLIECSAEIWNSLCKE
ncbi:MAG: hypothetical protein MHPSP_002520, partial [Paramarteilia canceri]